MKVPNGGGIALALAGTAAAFVAVDTPRGYWIAGVVSTLFLAIAVGAGVYDWRADRQLLRKHHGHVHLDYLRPAGEPPYRWWCDCTSWGRRDTWEEAHEAFDAHLRAAHVRARVHQ